MCAYWPYWYTSVAHTKTANMPIMITMLQTITSGVRDVLLPLLVATLDKSVLCVFEGTDKMAEVSMDSDLELLNEQRTKLSKCQ